MNSIIIAIDRLHAGYLGCYGNSWISTPEFNRFAAESFVFDQALIDTPRLSELYNSYWLGSHPWQRRSQHGAQSPSLASLLEGGGETTTLISDDVQMSGHPLAASFAEVIRLESPADASSAKAASASDPADTHLAGYFAVANEWLAAAREPFCLWLHTRGLGSAWDAPLELRRQYADEEEALPPDFVEVPCRKLPVDYGPDELLGICQAYAGQVTLLDSVLGGFLESLRSSPWHENTLLTVISTRGFPLGEHLRLGGCDDALYGELIQTPWLLRLPGGVGAMDRSQALVQPADLFATLLESHGIAPPSAANAGASVLPLVRGDHERLRDHAGIAGVGGERALRTPAWYLRLPGAESARGELYAKPDDRWEVNDVADRCSQQADALQQALAALEKAAAADTINQLAPLEESLVDDFA